MTREQQLKEFNAMMTMTSKMKSEGQVQGECGNGSSITAIVANYASLCNTSTMVNHFTRPPSLLLNLQTSLTKPSPLVSSKG